MIVYFHDIFNLKAACKTIPCLICKGVLYITKGLKFNDKIFFTCHSYHPDVVPLSYGCFYLLCPCKRYIESHAYIQWRRELANLIPQQITAGGIIL